MSMQASSKETGRMEKERKQRRAENREKENKEPLRLKENGREPTSGGGTIEMRCDGHVIIVKGKKRRHITFHLFFKSHISSHLIDDERERGGLLHHRCAACASH